MRVKGKGKGKDVLCFTQYHTMKTYLLLNEAPHHEDIWGKWKYSSAVF